jgi:Zn finger protein HypA/HybF involved in hydrogenase expression
MHNQRNYYRILEVQPDAPFEVIRQNFRVLMQKLRMHPHLGGDQNHAALINIAYETLRHPQKRAAYDKKLFENYDITTLSLGHLKPSSLFFKEHLQSLEAYTDFNLRNYYRLLQVQPDAHAAVIRERCLSMLHDNGDQNLLHEVYAILSSARQRVAYDNLLKKFGHGKAIQIMRARAGLPDRLQHRENIIYPFKAVNHHLQKSLDNYDQLSPSGSTSAAKIVSAPPAAGRCSFCKTPYSLAHNPHYSQFCLKCSSPLFSVNEELSEKSKRILVRREKTGTIFFYIYWPGHKFPGHLSDISPQGFRFSTEFGLDIGQLIKVDSEHFKAVAEVIHINIMNGLQNSIGVRFRTVAFSFPKGNFLKTSI